MALYRLKIWRGILSTFHHGPNGWLILSSQALVQVTLAIPAKPPWHTRCLGPGVFGTGPAAHRYSMSFRLRGNAAAVLLRSSYYASKHPDVMVGKSETGHGWAKKMAYVCGWRIEADLRYKRILYLYNCLHHSICSIVTSSLPFFPMTELTCRCAAHVWSPCSPGILRC